MHLFNRDEVNRKCKKDSRRDPQSEEEVRNHYRQAVNGKESCNPNR